MLVTGVYFDQLGLLGHPIRVDEKETSRPGCGDLSGLIYFPTAILSELFECTGTLCQLFLCTPVFMHLFIHTTGLIQFSNC